MAATPEDRHPRLNFWAVFAVVAAACAVTAFRLMGQIWPGPLSKPPSWQMIVVTTLWLSLFVMTTRVVRAQYGPLLRTYPRITGGPSYSAQLALSAVAISAMGAAILASAKLWSIAILLVGYGGSLATGGVLLLCALAYRARARAYRTPIESPIQLSFSHRDCLRGFVFIAALWTAIGTIVTGLFPLYADVDPMVWLGLAVVVVVPAAVFQAMPHVLLPSNGFFKTPHLSVFAWLRDLACVFVLAWALLASLSFGVQAGIARLLVFAPVLLGLSVTVALKVYEKDHATEAA